MKTITNIILKHAVLLALFAGAAFAFAQENETDPANTEPGTSVETKRANIADQQAERQAQVEEKKTEIQNNITERRAALQERAQERITNLAANMSNRMEAVIERIQNIIDRIESRMEKMAELGVDISKTKIALASAQASIDAATAEISTIDVDVVAAVGSEDVRSSWKAVKEKYMRVQDNLKTAHTELRAAVAALKAAAVEAESKNGVSDAVRANGETETGVTKVEN